MTSAMVRAIGPLVDRSSQPGACVPPPGTRPREGFIPESPQQAEGIRMEPPPSEPVARGTIPEASAAAAPPDEPPALWSRFQGLRVGPNRSLSVTPDQANSGRFVLPTTTQPAERSRATWTESETATGESASSADPKVER